MTLREERKSSRFVGVDDELFEVFIGRFAKMFCEGVLDVFTVLERDLL